MQLKSTSGNQRRTSHAQAQRPVDRNKYDLMLGISMLALSQLSEGTRGVCRRGPSRTSRPSHQCQRSHFLPGVLETGSTFHLSKRNLMFFLCVVIIITKTLGAPLCVHPTAGTVQPMSSELLCLGLYPIQYCRRACAWVRVASRSLVAALAGETRGPELVMVKRRFAPQSGNAKSRTTTARCPPSPPSLH